MIFTARQLQEKYQEQNVDLYMTFVDLTKAFDTVSRDGLWKIMAKFGCPPRYTAMVRQFHDGMQARVQNDGGYSEPFPVTNGVKQGCVMAPTLFSMMFSAMLTEVTGRFAPKPVPPGTIRSKPIFRRGRFTPGRFAPFVKNAIKFFKEI